MLILILLNFHLIVRFFSLSLCIYLVSTFTKGEQMIPVLNDCKVECAVFGNHDFDYGLENLISVTDKTNFPWLMSNVLDVDTNRPLAEGKTYHIINKNGIKLGIVGLVEEEWLATLATLDIDDLTYLDFVSEGKKLAKMLKDKEKCDYVVALTHMRSPNDCRLASNVEEIDIILGGHDHDYEIRKVNEKYIIKSGTDFRTFSKIDLHFEVPKRDDKCSHSLPVVCSNIEIKEVNVCSNIYDEDEQLKSKLDKYSEVIEGKMDIVLGQFGCDLDGRFASIRTQETNLGNFVCDIMLSSTHSDLAILNSGTLRSDRIHPKGDFKLRDLVTIMPMMDPMIVLSASGDQIHRALENGVSQWPKLEGRFPQVAGMKFAFDPKKPPKSRIDPRHIWVGDEPLDLKQKYRLVTKGYLHQGKDGYTVLKDCEVLVDEEECPELCTSIQNHFEAIKILTDSANHFHTRHRQSLFCVSRRSSVAKMHDGIHSGQSSNIVANVETSNGSNNLTNPSHRNSVMKKSQIFHSTESNAIRKNSTRKLSVGEIEYEQCKLEPKVEGRIVVITDEVTKGPHLK